MYKKDFDLLAVAMLMFSFVLATNYAVSVPTKGENNEITIDSKSKTVSYKITWNANGGKIGSKKTLAINIKKGTKIKKFPSTPKRSGYTFKGWYTKKSSGKKINVNTMPAKSITLYAQWKKGSSKVLSAEEMKFIGHWQYEDLVLSKPSNPEYHYHFFNKEGTFSYVKKSGTGKTQTNAKYKISKGKIYFSNIVYVPTGQR